MTASVVLKDTVWLAERLALSVSTVERLRSTSPQSLPPHLRFGNSIRYNQATVEDWIASNGTQVSIPAAGGES